MVNPSLKISMNRRRFIESCSAFAWFGSGPMGFVKGYEANELIPVAALITAYYPISHADVIVSKILEGYQRNGGHPKSNLSLVSMYVDQQHPHDISKALAERYGVRLCKSIEEALTLGTNRLQVSGVLSIAEHGDYPKVKRTEQKIYPRKRFFDETAAVFERCGSVVPFFNDKHFSYRWEDAKVMMETSRRLRIPLLAGSTLPLTWRFPEIELPQDCEIEEAVTIGYGPLEDYGFHALEAHQCMLERRRGGESGVRAIEVAIGKEILKTRQAGHWSADLFAAARRTMPGKSDDSATWDPLTTEYEGMSNQPACYLLQHSDGLRSAVVMTASYSGGFAFACKIKGEKVPRACWFKLQDWGTFGHFSYLLHAFEKTIRDGKSAYPPERTLLTTGILDRCMQLVASGGGKMESPELDFSYIGADWPFANHRDSNLILPHDKSS